jgi:hypothetical protein
MGAFGLPKAEARRSDAGFRHCCFSFKFGKIIKVIRKIRIASEYPE